MTDFESSEEDVLRELQELQVAGIPVVWPSGTDSRSKRRDGNHVSNFDGFHAGEDASPLVSVTEKSGAAEVAEASVPADVMAELLDLKRCGLSVVLPR